MTSAQPSQPVYCRPVGYTRFCRLLTIGSERHATACLASIPADEPVIITARTPQDDEFCSACKFDLAAKRSRCATIDLRPWVGEIGVRAEVGIIGDEVMEFEK